MSRTVYAADLFCGAGGASYGLIRACKELGYELDLVAVNHSQAAIATHEANFPGHIHFCKGVDAVNPLAAVPGGYLDLLLAGPECVFFSKARGGAPVNAQRRSTFFDIGNWLETLYVQNVVIENVEEFLDAGPCYPLNHPDPKKAGRPIKELKGRDFNLFVGFLKEIGYRVEWRILEAHKLGGRTSRKRLFLQAVRGEGAIVWPKESHMDAGELARMAISRPESAALYQPFRTARECIDWDIKGTSIYTREADGKRPLAEATLRRIFAGVRKFSGLPFLMQMAQTGANDGGMCYRLDRPLTTVTTKNSHALVEPLLVVFRNNMDGAILDKPMHTLTTSRGHFGLLEPIAFLTAAKNERPGEEGRPGQKPRTHDLDSPMPVVPANGRPGDLVEAFLTLGYGGHTARGLDAPLQTICASYEHFGLVEVPPILVHYNGGNRAQGMDTPFTTLDTSNRFALCHFVVKYNSTGGALSLEEPLDTITTNDRFGLVELRVVGIEDGVTIAEGRVVGWLDILFRMLEPHELALAQGFPKSYIFLGTREERVRQIGNAWEGETATAICRAALGRAGAIPPSAPDFSELHRLLGWSPSPGATAAAKGRAALCPVPQDLFTAQSGAMA
jgi:DNA (cytosine-5)-methyltransferase 1